MSLQSKISGLVCFTAMLIAYTSSQQTIKTIGNYDIVQDAAVTKYCASYNVDEFRKKSLNEQPKRSSFILAINNAGEDSLVKFAKHRDVWKFVKEGWWNFLKLIAIPLTGSLISIFFVPGVVFWMIWRCCFKSRNSTDKFEKRRDYCKLFVNCMVIFLMLALLGVGIVWLLEVIGVISSLGPMSCTASLAFSEALNGSAKPIFFPGISGYKFLVNHLADGINKTLNDSKSAASYNTITKKIVAYDMPKLNISIIDAFKQFYTTFKNAKVKNFDKPDDDASAVGLNMTSTMADMIKPDISTEHDALATLSNRLHQTASLFAKAFSDNNESMTLVNVSFIFANFTTNVDDHMNKMKKSILTNFDYHATRLYALVMFMIFGISVLVILLLYSAFGFVNIVLKSFNWLVYISKSIMLCTAVLGCLMSIIALIFVIFSGIMVNTCELFGRALTDPNMMTQLQVTSQVQKVFDTCIYANSSGEFLNIMEENDKQSIDDLNLAYQILSGFTNSTRIDAQISKSNSTIAVGMYDGHLQSNILTYKTIDQYSPATPYNDLQTAMNKLKVTLKGKIGDTFAMADQYCAVGSNISPPADMKADNSNMCLLLPNITAKLSDRSWYASLTATEKSQIDGMKKSQENYTDTIKYYVGNYSGSPTTPGIMTQDLFTKYKDSMADYKNIRGFFSEAAKFFEADPINSNKSVLFNCTIVRNQVLYVRSALCGQFIDTFSMQSFWLGILGLCTSLLGICMCVQLKLIDRDMNKLPNHMKTDTEPCIEMNELML